MVTFYNPALKEESKNEPARIIPLREREPLLDWLKRTNRFKPNESDEPYADDMSEELEEIMGGGTSEDTVGENN
ncbi:MAG: DUF3134 family protein [Coleofasciculaceae cyanobacterium]